MIEIRTKLRASALALALAGFTTVGCVDNSGNKTYPCPDAGGDTASDTPVTSDAPAGDTAATGDTAAPSDTGASSDSAAPTDTAAPADTATDRGDTATSDAPGTDVRIDGSLPG